MESWKSKDIDEFYEQAGLRSSNSFDEMVAREIGKVALLLMTDDGVPISEWLVKQIAEKHGKTERDVIDSIRNLRAGNIEFYGFFGPFLCFWDRREDNSFCVVLHTGWIQALSVLLMVKPVNN